MRYLPPVEFHLSSPDWTGCPSASLQTDICFTGRSNSGKSSLISAISNQHNLARVSGTPGKTRLINYFKIRPVGQNRNAGADWYLVDLPGFGYAKMPALEQKKLRLMVDQFLANNQLSVQFLKLYI